MADMAEITPLTESVEQTGWCKKMATVGFIDLHALL